jgi:hypothetical protein
MPFYVFAVIPAKMASQTPHAYVTGNITEAEYQHTYGQSPANAGIPGQTNAGFPTKAAAQAAANAFNKNPGPPLGGVTGPSVVPKISNPVAGIAEVGAVLKAFFQQITRAEMWRSLGWTVLGFLLMIIGAALWLKKEGYLPDAVPVPLPV